MKVTVIFEDRQRRLFELEDDLISSLVLLIEKHENLEGRALFFQGRQISEDETFTIEKIPDGAVIRTDVADNPVERKKTAEPEPEDEEDQMRAMLGFGSFGSTKGSAHSDSSGARVIKKAKHRQYMNLKGDKSIVDS